jgi:hypothetical protein
MTLRNSCPRNCLYCDKRPSRSLGTSASGDVHLRVQWECLVLERVMGISVSAQARAALAEFSSVSRLYA